MTVRIHTVGGFTYAANAADIPKFRTPKRVDSYTYKPEYWTLEEVLLYWDILCITKGILFLPGSKEGTGVRNATIRVRDIISIEDTDAVEAVL